MVFGRNTDIELLVNEYFRTKTLILSGIAQRQANAIQRELLKLRSQDLTLPEIARGISEKFRSIFRNRAALIARTETHNVASFANHKYHQNVADNLGINMKKRWCAVADGRIRLFYADETARLLTRNSDFIEHEPTKHAGDPA